MYEQGIEAITHFPTPQTFEEAAPSAPLLSRHIWRPRRGAQLRAAVEDLLPERVESLPVKRSHVWPHATTYFREGPEHHDDYAAHVERLRARPEDETPHERMERYSHLGDLLRLHPDHCHEGVDLQRSALDLARSLGDQKARASIELRLAVALQYAGRHAAALRHYARADTIIRVKRVRMMRDRVELHRGTCLAEMGNIEGARAAFEEALGLLGKRKAPDPMLVGRAEAALAGLETWRPAGSDDPARTVN